VLKFLSEIDRLICTCDFVGYGPQSRECVNIFLDYPLPLFLCLGNHDFHENRIIINTGSVGQPRDGTGNASFSIIGLDENIIEFYDLEYETEPFYELTKKKYAPEVQNSSFWVNRLGHFSRKNS
jgi:hypothetical protein